jgi:hypothetical protein
MGAASAGAVGGMGVGGDSVGGTSVGVGAFVASGVGDGTPGGAVATTDCSVGVAMLPIPVAPWRRTPTAMPMMTARRARKMYSGSNRRARA